jgi:alkyl hydroperoxide reductase subunit AhpC
VGDLVLAPERLHARVKFLPEFEKRGMKVIALLCNDVESH